MIGPPLIVALIAGVALGGFYFGSLWWVLRQVASLRHPELLLLASFIVRTAITLTGFYLVMEGHWERIAACMVGFLLARTVLVYLLRPSGEPLKVTQG